MGKGLSQDGISYVLAVGLGTKITWNQSSVIVAFKNLLSINYCSCDQVDWFDNLCPIFL